MKSQCGSKYMKENGGERCMLQVKAALISHDFESFLFCSVTTFYFYVLNKISLSN